MGNELPSLIQRSHHVIHQAEHRRLSLIHHRRPASLRDGRFVPSRPHGQSSDARLNFIGAWADEMIIPMKCSLALWHFIHSSSSFLCVMQKGCSSRADPKLRPRPQQHLNHDSSYAHLLSSALILFCSSGLE